MHVATLALVLVVLADAGRGQWFFGDEWDFLLFRGLTGSRFGLLRPHNEHWSTIPILWYRGVFGVFGLKTYWPYLAGLFATHLLVVHCLWRLTRRAGVGAALATAVALVMGLFGGGAENLIWAFQVGFIGSLAAGLVLALLLDAHGSPRRVAVVAAGGVACLMLSGVSVVMVAGVGLGALGRWGWRKALAATAPAAIVYALWFAAEGRVGLEGGTAVHRGELTDIPRYVSVGLSTTLGTPFRNDRVGAALLVVVLVVLVIRGPAWWRRAPELFGLAAAAPVMFAVIAQGRGALQEPSSPRYLYLAAGMLLPLIAFGVQQLVDDRAPRVAVAALACVAMSVVGVDSLRDYALVERGRELALRGQMLAAAQLGYAGLAPVVVDTPDFRFATDVTIGHLSAMRARDELPSVPLSSRNLALARLAVQTFVGPSDGNEPLTGAAGELAPGATATRRGDCYDVDLRGTNLVVRLRPGSDRAAFSLTPASRGEARVYVPYDGGFAGTRAVTLRAGRRALARTAVRESAVFQLPPGTNTICGISWANA